MKGCSLIRGVHYERFHCSLVSQVLSSHIFMDDTLIPPFTPISHPPVSTDERRRQSPSQPHSESAAAYSLLHVTRSTRRPERAVPRRPCCVRPPSLAAGRLRVYAPSPAPPAGHAVASRPLCGRAPADDPEINIKSIVSVSNV